MRACGERLTIRQERLQVLPYDFETMKNCRRSLDATP